MAYIIYYLKCKNGKMYVGLTRKMFEQRIHQHFSDGKTPLSKAMQEQGLENFEMGILATTQDAREAQALERQYIEKFDSISKGYNRSLGGQLGNCSIYNDDDVYNSCKKYSSIAKWAKEHPGEYGVARYKSDLMTLCRNKIYENKRVLKLLEKINDKVKTTKWL